MTHRTLRSLASLAVTLEGLAIVFLAVWQAVALAGGDTVDPVSSLALIALTALFAVAVIAFGVGVQRGATWARSGAIVTQLLIVSVGLGAVSGAYAHPSVGLWLGIPALVVLGMLIALTRRVAREERERPGPEGE